ncbi:acyl carrier protein [Prauserella shujinwangii]|uniref:Acyl carrier protein n=1 Tax=Prauserella shujinwangii TaxID=1453103 RepID=A0A2T0M3Y3_9PSEU|nr:acyl carrier protein [Prauserella shujinwangii]PRX51465.1 acyl carrier protein [Prauserella shujinwangii]
MVSDVSGELTEILTTNFDVDSADIDPERTLDELGVDSVATIELVDILKERFGIAVDEDELTNKSTVGQVISAVTAKRSA